MRFVVECINSGSISPAYHMEFRGNSVFTVDLIIGMILLCLAYAFIAGRVFNRSISADGQTFSHFCTIGVIMGVLSIIGWLTDSPPSRLVFFGVASLVIILVALLAASAWPQIKNHFVRAWRAKPPSWPHAGYHNFFSRNQPKYHDWLLLPCLMALMFLVLFSLVGVWYGYSKPTRISSIALRMNQVNRKMQFQVYPCFYRNGRFSFILFENQIDPHIHRSWTNWTQLYLATKDIHLRLKNVFMLHYFGSTSENGLESIAVHFQIESQPREEERQVNLSVKSLPVPEETMLKMVENQLAVRHPQIHQRFAAREARIPVIAKFLFTILTAAALISLGIYYTLVWRKYRIINKELARVASQHEAEARRIREEHEHRLREQQRRRDADFARRQAQLDEQERKRREWEEAPKQRRCRKCDFVFPEYSIPRCPKCNSSDFEVILV